MKDPSLRFIACALVVGLVGIAFPAPAGDGPIVALFDLEDKGASLDVRLAANLVDFLATRMAQDGYQVIPRDQIRTRLRTYQAESYKACYDQGCQIELGRELAAQKTLSTQVLKIGANCQVAATLYDLRRATTDLAASAEATCTDEESLLAAFKSIADQVAAPLQESKRETGSRLSELEQLFQGSSAPVVERMTKGWDLVSRIAGDTMVAPEARVSVVKRFLDSFPDNNPFLPEAQKLLLSLSPGGVVVKTDPEGAWVSIDGKPAGAAPLVHELAAGEHRIEASKPGRSPVAQTVQVSQGQQTELQLSLPMQPLRIWGHAAFWTGLGVALVGGICGVGAYIEGQEYNNHWDSLDSAGRSRAFAGAMWAGLGAGVALMIAGIILWEFPAGEAEATGSPRPSVGLAPDGRGLGAVISGRW